MRMRRQPMYRWTPWMPRSPTPFQNIRTSLPSNETADWPYLLDRTWKKKRQKTLHRRRPTGQCASLKMPVSHANSGTLCHSSFAQPVLEEMKVIRQLRSFLIFFSQRSNRRLTTRVVPGTTCSVVLRVREMRSWEGHPASSIKILLVGSNPNQHTQSFCYNCCYLLRLRRCVMHHCRKVSYHSVSDSRSLHLE